jgi:undecaprenyl-diphosphatase
MVSRRWQRTWLIVAAVCALGFAALAAVVNGQGSVAFDEPVGTLVRGLGIPVDVWLAISDAGATVLIAVGIGLVLALLSLGRVPLAIIVAVALLAGTFGTEILKLWVERPRPPDPLAPFVGSSFPSGHTFNSTVTYGLVALVMWRSALPMVARRAVVAALITLVAFIGLSRIGLGVHYPSDVVAGWLGGTAIVATVAAVPAAIFFARWRRRTGEPAEPASAPDASGSAEGPAGGGPGLSRVHDGPQHGARIRPAPPPGEG